MKQEIKYLYDITKFNKKASLENTKEMLFRLGEPQKGTKVIHVAGTNGKGSVCAYIDNILLCEGYKTGRFTSPHLIHINERISINGNSICDDTFKKAFYKVKKVSLEMKDAGYEHPSFFEFLFGMAMDIFAQAKVEYIILETGLGGRLDATNIIENPILTIITSISLDHTEILGNTIQDIAKEKAGIIKPLVPVIFMDVDKEITDVISQRAEQLKAPICVIHKRDIIQVIKNDKYIDFSMENRYYKDKDFRLKTGGIYQVENAALAVTAIAVGGLSTIDNVVKGLYATSWQGRMQEVVKNVYVDGAHNVNAIRCFLESVTSDSCKGRRILIFSAVKDKYYKTMIQEICESKQFDSYIVVSMQNSRTTNMDELGHIFQQYTEKNIDKRSTVEQALQQGRLLQQEKDYIYIVGSLYLVGEVLEQYQKEKKND